MKETLHRIAAAGGMAWLAVAVCAALAAAAFPFDAAVAAWVKGAVREEHHFAVHLVGNLGHGVALGLIFVTLAVLYGEERTGVGGLMAIITGGLTADALRMLFNRTRPDGDPFSFPSAHSACAFAAAAVLARRWPRRWYLFYLAAAAVGGSRVLLLKHFPSDVLAGAALGITFGLACAAVADGMRWLRDPETMRWVRGLLASMLVLAVIAPEGLPDPLGLLAGPAVLLILVRRATSLLEPQLSHDGQS